MMKKLTHIGFIAFTLFYVLCSVLRPQPALAEGNPFVPTTDVLNTGLSAQFGADELAEASQNIANFKDITGAYYDSTLNRVVFIGTTTGSNPNYNQDDMAVAVRAFLYNGTLPSLSIDDDPNNPTGPTALVNYTGGIQNTSFANDLFNADYKLKQYAIGYDPSQHQISSAVPTYQSVVTRYLALQPSPVAGNESKYIISPQSVSIKNASSATAMAFSTVSMQVSAQPVNQNNDALWNQAATNFANDLTANYNAYAQETPYFTQAQQLAKIVAIAKWVSDNSIPADALVARNYTPQVVSTPSTVQKVSTPTGYSAQGAVNYNTPNTYLTDDGTASGLKSAAQAADSSREDVTWTFTNGGQQYTAVAVAAGAFKSLGSFSTAVSDFSTPIAGDQTLSFTRKYSSFSSGQFGIGQGWDFMPARLYNNSEPLMITICPDLSTHLTKIAIDTQSGHETFTYSCTSGNYGADDASFHSSVSLAGDLSSGTITSWDQTKYNFSLNSTLGVYQLTSTIDKNTNAINYSYDVNGKLTSVADTHNHPLSLAYNAQNLISSVTDWAGRVVQYTYDTNGHLTGVTDPNGNTTNYGYDTNGRLTTVTDRTGTVVVTNTYNSDARLSTSKNAANLLITYSYDNVNRAITQTDSNNHVTKTTYDSNARILQQTDPNNKSAIYTYGSENVPLTYKDRNGNTQTFTYDTRGNMLSATFPDTSVINYTYDGNNRVTKIMDGRYGSPARETDYTYDASGNLTQKKVAGVATNFTYDTSGEVLTTTDPLSNTTTYTRDSLGDELTSTDPYSKTTTNTYDSLGRLTQTKDANNNTASYTYDTNGNLLTKTDDAGTTTNVYDKEDRLTKVTLPTNAVTQFTYNAAGSKTSVLDALSNTTTYGYDAYQNLTSQQDALNHTTTNAFNSLNRQSSSTTPLGKATSWQYDNNGNLTQRTDANNKVTNYQYDALNRLTKITYPDSTTITYTYDNRGNLTQMVDPNGTSSYIYDTFDRMTKATNQYNQSVQYTYDNNGNNLTITYPDNKVVTYTYDNDNRMKTVKDWNNLVTTYTYNDNGTLATQADPNNVTAYFSYDNANRLSTLEYKTGATSQAKYVYTRDGAGNILTDTESGAFVQGSTITYGYDALGRVTSFSSTPGGRVGNGTYTYDKVGNRLTQNTSNFNRTYVYDNDNKLTSQTDPTYGTFNQTYDSNGNLTTKKDVNLTKTLFYNFENNLTKYTDQFNNTDTYKYDGLGNRLEYDDVNSNKTRYITDLTNSLPRVLADYDVVNSKIKNWYVYGLGLIAEYQGHSDASLAQYDIVDGFGNTRFLADSTGNTFGAQEYYDPFGNVTWHTGGNAAFLFSSQRLDSDPNLYYMRARYYDPTIGRFTSRDPLAGNVMMPLTQNAYIYAGDNPINLSDPLGLDYANFNMSVNAATFGFLFSNGDIYPYIGAGAIPEGVSVSVTYSKAKAATGFSFSGSMSKIRTILVINYTPGDKKPTIEGGGVIYGVGAKTEFSGTVVYTFPNIVEKAYSN